MIEEDDEELEGITVVCPYCGALILVPKGYNRPTFLCTRCKKAVPLDEKMLEALNAAPKGE